MGDGGKYVIDEDWEECRTCDCSLGDSSMEWVHWWGVSGKGNPNFPPSQNSWKYLARFPLRPRESNFWSRPWCHTVSNARLMSKNTQTQYLFHQQCAACMLLQSCKGVRGAVSCSKAALVWGTGSYLILNIVAVSGWSFCPSVLPRQLRRVMGR